ncbi:hypothetical protein BH09BAC5_BH09BAC5_11360 [soil metagenome]
MKRICYLTFNDYPSGIYSGQVIDVCKFWRTELKLQVTLIAFISFRGFNKNKKRIKEELPDAIVLPMIPKARNWTLNRFILGRFIRKIKPDVIVGRGPFATLLALNFRKDRRVCFDARGAYTAELSEYNVLPDEKIKRNIYEIEKAAVFKSDCRLAVSNALIGYWKKEFDFRDVCHIIVPCTLNEIFFCENESLNLQRNFRETMGFKEDEIVLVYSGSSAEWQSFESMDLSIYNLLEKQKNIKVLLLAKPFKNPLKIQIDFPERVNQMWVKSDEVKDILKACDYGWLVRENSVTNLVASPVKFAEYLASGLKVVISETLGDYSEFVRIHKAGIVVSGDMKFSLSKISTEEKKAMNFLAKKYFSKSAYIEDYKKLLGL